MTTRRAIVLASAAAVAAPRVQAGTVPLGVVSLPAAFLYDPAAPSAPPQVRLFYPAAQAVPAHDAAADDDFAAMVGAGAEAQVLGGDARRTLLLYHGGWPGTGPSNAPLIAALAGRGYVVAILSYPARLPTMTDAAYAAARAALPDTMDFATEAAAAATVARADRWVGERAADCARLLDRLGSAALAGIAGQLAAALDLQRVGVVGYSFGGAVAAECATVDPRFAAIVNIDGWEFGRARREGVRAPFLVVSDDGPLPTAADLDSPDISWRMQARLTMVDLDALMAHLHRWGGAFATIAGADHLSLGEVAIPFGIRDWLRGNRALRARTATIVDAVVMAFVDATLRGTGAFPGDLAKRFADLKLDLYPRPTTPDL